jgi:hypothetical protein
VLLLALLLEPIKPPPPVLALLVAAPPVPAAVVALEPDAVLVPELWLLALVVVEAAPPEPPAPVLALEPPPLPPAPSSRWLKSRSTPQPARIVAPNPRATSVNRWRMFLPRLRESALPHKITRPARA